MSVPKDQYFLVDRQAIEKIAGFVDVAGRRVLEVGPGEGSLTRALLDRGAVVVAVELDPILVDRLKTTFAGEIAEGRLHLIQGDATRVDLPPFDVVVSNLPYSISSKITFRLLEIGFDVAILTYQKEFAQRMVAPPGTPNSGRLSVMVQTYATVKPVLELSPNVFKPRPQVRSWVVRVTPHPPPHPIRDRKVYADVVRVLFSHRRKTVRKGLKSGKNIFDAETIERAVDTLPDEILQRRPEELSLAEFAEIANMMAGMMEGGPVYPPGEDTHLLLRAARREVRTSDRVLEIGTGSGLVARELAPLAAAVTATDVNPHAVRAARSRGVEAVRTDLAAGVAGPFDLVLFNPPYLPTTPEDRIDDWLEHALDGGPTGRKVIERFIEDVGRVLAPFGRILLVVSSLTGISEVRDLFTRQGFVSFAVAEERLEGETLYVLRAVRDLCRCGA